MRIKLQNGDVFEGTPAEYIELQKILNKKKRTPGILRDRPTPVVRSTKKRKRSKRWTPAEDKILRDNAHLSIYQLSQKLPGRTKKQIVKRIYNQYMSIKQFQERFAKK